MRKLCVLWLFIPLFSYATYFYAPAKYDCLVQDNETCLCSPDKPSPYFQPFPIHPSGCEHKNVPFDYAVFYHVGTEPVINIFYGKDDQFKMMVLPNVQSMPYYTAKNWLPNGNYVQECHSSSSDCLFQVVK